MTEYYSFRFEQGVKQHIIAVVHNYAIESYHCIMNAQE